MAAARRASKSVTDDLEERVNAIVDRREAKRAASAALASASAAQEHGKAARALALEDDRRKFWWAKVWLGSLALLLLLGAFCYYVPPGSVPPAADGVIVFMFVGLFATLVCGMVCSTEW